MKLKGSCYSWKFMDSFIDFFCSVGVQNKELTPVWKVFCQLRYILSPYIIFKTWTQKEQFVISIPLYILENTLSNCYTKLRMVVILNFKCLPREYTYIMRSLPLQHSKSTETNKQFLAFPVYQSMNIFKLWKIIKYLY